MQTLGEIVEATLAQLRGYTRDQEMSTHLTSAITFDAREIAVNDASVLTRGRIQIEDELIWVDSADRGNSTGAIPPYGRGFDSSTAAAHAAGTRVVVQPLYPRKMVKDNINQSIRTVGQKLYGVETVTLAGDPTTATYDLPAYTRDVLSVKVSERNPSLANVEPAWARNWTFDKHAPTAMSDTGKALYLYGSGVDPTLDITVVISRDPIAIYFDSQLFTECLLPLSAADVVYLLTASRMLNMTTSMTVNTRAVDAHSMNSKVPVDTASSQSKYLYQLAMSRLEEERQRLLNETIQRAHYSRRG